MSRLRRLSVPEWDALTWRHAPPHGVAAFSPVSVFPLLFAPIWISRLFYFCSKFRWISLLSVSAWACGVALILMKYSTRAFRAAWILALPLLRRPILASLCEDAVNRVCLAIRYRRWSTPPLLLLLSFATPRVLILREGSRLVVFPALQTCLHRCAKRCGQQTGVSFPICSSTLFLPGSEIFLVLATTNHAPRLAPIHRAGFFLHQRLVREEDCRRLRHRRAQLRTKCGSAPLRATVTERATRSTESLKKLSG